MTTINVLQEVIQPLERWFGKELPEGRAHVYQEVLGSFSSKTLQKAMGLVKWEWTQQSIPQPSVIREFCEKAEETPDKTGDKTFNYGQNSNGSVCSCGKHHGVGAWSPEQRARSYAWNRGRNVNYTTNVREFLETYEKAHGPVQL